MVTNLNLSYSQELGLLETHHFHLHPALCWERQSTLRVCAALGHSPEADPRAAHPCGIPRHRDNHRHCSAPCAMETFSHTAQSPPVPHTLKAWLSLLFIGDLKLLSLGWFLNLSPPALPGLANVNTRAENEESGWCSSSLMSVPSPSSGWTLLDLLKLLLTPCDTVPLQVAMDESLWLLAQLHPQLQPWHRPQERGQPEPQKTLR